MHFNLIGGHMQATTKLNDVHFAAVLPDLVKNWTL